MWLFQVNKNIARFKTFIFLAGFWNAGTGCVVFKCLNIVKYNWYKQMIAVV